MNKRRARWDQWPVALGFTLILAGIILLAVFVVGYIAQHQNPPWRGGS